ncbi:MAG: hypothetical protein ABIQ39_13680, partial [Ilumatobacteraceae bacterium]
RLAVDDEVETEDLQVPESWVQTCYACTHAMFGDSGTYCSVFSENILSEKLAGQDCEAFESGDGKSYVRLG